MRSQEMPYFFTCSRKKERNNEIYLNYYTKLKFTICVELLDT